jgi:hypothetical protein
MIVVVKVFMMAVMVNVEIDDATGDIGKETDTNLAEGVVEYSRCSAHICSKPVG